MRRLWVLLLLAACAKEAPPVQQGEVPGLLRNPTAPLASQADVTAERLQGEWFVRQDVSDQREHNSFQFQLDNESLSLMRCRLLGGGIGCDGETLLVPSGPGRWAAKAVDQWPSIPDGEMWVLWMDFDDRTLVIGDPLGRYVWVLDRKPEGGADRIKAARDILEWYGYDLDQLETVQ